MGRTQHARELVAIVNHAEMTPALKSYEIKRPGRTDADERSLWKKKH